MAETRIVNRLDLSTFRKRLQSLYDHWRQHKDEYWGSSDVLAIATPPSENVRYLKSSALSIWLLGYEFPETIMVFGDEHVYFLCSQKEASLLKVVKKSAKETVGVDVVVHTKAENENGSNGMESILRAIRSRSKSGNDNAASTVGYLAREAPEGELLKIWSDKLKNSGLTLSDISGGLSDLFAVKDENEITCIKKAGYLTASAMKKFVVPKIEKVIDEEKIVTHASLMDVTEKVILNPAKIGVKLKADMIGICYPPIFQSGGKFDLRPSASSNEDHLYYGSSSIIICAMGSSYNSYCSNIARTYLIDSNAVQSKAYEVLLKAHDAAIFALKPRNKASAVYKAALSVVERDAPELIPNLTKSAGTGIGLEFRESGLSLNAENDRVLKAGMVFNVSLGFRNLQAKTSSNPKSQNFSLLLADTVIMTGDICYIATSASSKSFEDVAYSFNEEAEEEYQPKMKVEPKIKDVFSKATLRSDNGEMSKEGIRKQHQAELARQKNEETARRLAGVESGKGNGRAMVRGASELIAYKSVNEVPPPREMMIQVDQKNEAILIPIYGCMVPFHVAMVKNVTSQQDTNRYCYVRIVFNVPGTTPRDASCLKNQGAVYLKEVSFRSKDSRHISEVVQLIKTLRRNVMDRESERAERATLVTQEKLVLLDNKFKPIRLHNVWIRPAFGGRGRKLSGTLETHVNGFRYSTSRGTDERVDIMYGNIKHAFFQPAEKEMITLVHFHLHNHIMVGNKKANDVQFYVEVMEMVQNIGGGKRSAYDPDEIEEEQRERDRKNKINADFQKFVNLVNDLWGQTQFKGLNLEFDQPLRELGFHGVHKNSSVFLVPTSSCLVELIETPFLVISLSDIEIVNLERVGLAQKNFDMAIVFKDFKRDPKVIESIPSSSLDGVKEWLDTTDIKYYESRLNLKWRPILKTITDDPQQFIEQGGWEFLNLEGAGSDSDDDSGESEQGYEPSDAESESESEDDDSDSESLVESEDDDDDQEEDSEEEDEGKTWEELEREASNADREMGNESDSEDERRRRKMKAAGKSRAGPSSSSASAASKRMKLR